MAAGHLSPPGTESGPCEEECIHKDCASTRFLASRLCAECGEPIGYDTRFFQDENWSVLTHLRCAP